MTEVSGADIAHTVDSVLQAHLDVVQRTRQEQSLAIGRAAELVLDTLRRGNKILLCGNGGSAADCQHMAAEIVGRFEVERPGLPAIALTTDSSNLTALGNDMGYAAVFSRQVQAIASPGDLLWAYSTSGKSANILLAVEVARQVGCRVLAMTGALPNPLAGLADVVIAVPDQSTARIQEVHLVVGHILCALIDREWSV